VALRGRDRTVSQCPRAAIWLALALNTIGALLVPPTTVAIDAGALPVPPKTAAPAVSVFALQRLPVDVAVGQLIAVSFPGNTVTPELRRLIVDYKVGAVLLFRRNFANAADLARLTGQLEALGREARLPAPPLVTLDQEGGRVLRVTDGVAPLPAALALAGGGAEAVRQATAATADGLRRLGIGLNLAPVADVRTNPDDAVIGDRAFGGDPDQVAVMVAAAVSGLHQSGIGATLKHFPGLGGAAGDPHAAMPTEWRTVEEWASTLALGFAAGIAAGADAVMTTAEYVPGLDPTWTPALFSRPVVTGLLRERLGFQGVIVSDALDMAGITAAYALPQAAVAAVAAGNDLLLLGAGNSDAAEAAIAAIREAVAAGIIPADQIEESAARIVALRSRWPDPRFSPTGAVAWPPSQ